MKTNEKRGGGGGVKAAEYKRSDKVHSKAQTQGKENKETNFKKKARSTKSNSRQIN